ncbi:MAG: hypothetical protein D6826_03275, partial [Alphaproteobacteria bacterium]
MSESTRTARPLDGLAAMLLRRPGLFTAAAILLHGALWWLVQIAFSPNLPLDMIEQLAWGREWQLVYYKHPPLSAWTLEALVRLFGNRQEILFLSGPAFVALTMWAVWRLGRRVADPRAAALAALALTGTIYYGFTSPEFNHNVAQYPFFALLPLALHRAMQGDRIADWALVGLWTALGLYAKYSAALPVVAAGLFLIAHPRGRAALRRPGPYVAAAIALLVLVPHLYALWQIDFLPFRFPVERAGAAREGLDHLTNPARFLLAQLLAVLGTLVLVGLTMGRGNAPMASEGTPPESIAEKRFNRAFVLALGLGPFALALAIDAVTGLRFRSMWGAAFFPLLALAVFVVRPPVPTPARGRRFIAMWLLLLGAGLAAFAGKAVLDPWLKGTGSRIHFPGPAVAAAMAESWRTLAPDRPLRIVAGSEWVAGNIAFYGPAQGPQRPSVFIDASRVKSPWI